MLPLHATAHRHRDATPVISFATFSHIVTTLPSVRYFSSPDHPIARCFAFDAFRPSPDSSLNTPA